MTLKSAPYYWVVCNFPDCGASAQEGSEYAAWADPGYAVDTAIDGGFLTDLDGERHYCDGHPTIWASDHFEEGPPFPDPPFLLIHDMEDDEDGRVTLVVDR